MTDEELDPESAELLAGGRVEREPEPGAKDRVARRLALAMEAPEPRRLPLLRGPGALVAALAASFALGAGLHALARPAPRTATTAPPPHAPGNPVPPSSHGVRVLGAFADNTGRELLDDASGRLMKGDAAGAITRLDEHARLHPNGPLTELREALYVEALARAGRGAEARARAARFFASSPDSLLGPAVSDALGRIPDE